jgi:GNAT superfamily N-acetyltransferase
VKTVFEPLSQKNWPAFENLFGEKGACGGCWCMHWRLKAADFVKQRGEGNRKAMQKLVKNGPPLGVLAMIDGEAVGWCAVAPRAQYPRFETSKLLQPVDNQPVWSITCFFIDKAYRRQGLSVKLLKVAAAFAFENGATVVEAYPVAPGAAHYTEVFAWTGFASAFVQAGFTEVARRSEKRPIMRLYKEKTRK